MSSAIFQRKGVPLGNQVQLLTWQKRKASSLPMLHSSAMSNSTSFSFSSRISCTELSRCHAGYSHGGFQLGKWGYPNSSLVGFVNGKISPIAGWWLGLLPCQESPISHCWQEKSYRKIICAMVKDGKSHGLLRGMALHILHPKVEHQPSSQVISWFIIPITIDITP